MIENGTRRVDSLVGGRRQAGIFSGTVIGLWIFLAIFIPGHMFDGLLERAFVILVVVASLFTIILRGIPRRFGYVSMCYVLVAFFFATLVSALAYTVTLLRMPVETGIRDVLEIIRYPICLGFIVFLAPFFRTNWISIFEFIVIASLFFSLAVFILYIYEIPMISLFIKDIVYADTKTGIDFDGYMRLAVPFENPNFFAFYLVMIFSYLLFFSNLKGRLGFVFIALALLFLTGSRSGWIASAIVFVFFTFGIVMELLLHKKSDFIITLMAISLVVMMGAWSYGDLLMDSTRVRMLTDAIMDGGILTEENAAGRLNMVQMSMKYFFESPLIGWGSMKYGEMDVIDNQFAAWIFRGGLIGFLAIVAFFLMSFVSQIRSAYGPMMTMGVLAFWASVFFLLQTGAFFDNFRLFFLFLVFTMAIWRYIAVDQRTSRSVC